MNINQATPAPGDTVTCKVPMEAHYSGYAGNPEMLFKPGMVGTVASIAAKVCIMDGEGYDDKEDFVVVDFQCPETKRRERVGLNFCNTVLLPNAAPLSVEQYASLGRISF
jgi:hypothetical protein